MAPFVRMTHEFPEDLSTGIRVVFRDTMFRDMEHIA